MKQHENVIIFASSSIFFISLLYTFILDFSQNVNIELLIASVSDWFFTVLAFTLVIKTHPRRLFYLYNHFNSTVRAVLNRNVVIICSLSFIVMYFAYTRLDLILVGATREDIVFGNTSNRIMSLVSPLVIFICGYSIFFKLRAINIIFLLFGVMAIGIYNLSRSEFASLIFITLSFAIIKKISKKQLLFFSCFFAVIIFFVSVMTIYQGRAGSLNSSLMAVLESFFKYKAFSFYLSKYSINQVNGDFEHILYPFLGFIIERFLSMIDLVSNPISVQDSSFITDFHRLGSNSEYDANVLYPWWSWFYGSFGPLGIILKFIYVLCALSVIIRTKFAFTFIYFVYVMLFTSFYRHPLLNADSFFYLLAILLLDLFILVNVKRDNLTS